MLNLVLTIGTVCGKNLCVSKGNDQAWQDQALIEQAPINLNRLDPNNRVTFPTLSVIEMKRTEGFERKVRTPLKLAKATLVWAVTYPKARMISRPCSER